MMAAIYNFYQNLILFTRQTYFPHFNY